MSVDYNYCEICGDSKHDDICYMRFINDKETNLCNSCVSKLIKKTELVKYEKDDIKYDIYSKKTKDYLSDGEEVYGYTQKGLENEIKTIDIEISILQDKRKRYEELLK